MKRRFTFLPLTLLLVVALLLPVLPVYAQPDADAVAQRITEIAQGEPAFEENFRRENADWELDLESEESSLRFQAGTYRTGAISANLFVWGILDRETTDFLVQADAYRVAGPTNNEFGIVFRHKDTDNFYVFLISSDGFYTLRKMEDGAWSDLTAWTESALIEQDESAVNTVGVYAEGTTIGLLINGELVETVEDDTFATGMIGLSAGTYEEGSLEVAWDDFTLWELGQGIVPAELPTDDPTEEPVEGPTEEPTEEPVAEPTEEPVGEPTDEPVEEPTDDPSDEPTEEPTEEPVEEPTPEAVETPEPQDIAGLLDTIRNDDPILSEEFRRDTGIWSLESDENVDYALRSRELRINVIADNWMGWSLLSDHNDTADMLLEADVSQADGPLLSEYGLIFRYQDNSNFYLYAIAPDGSYSFWSMVNNEWSELLPWASSREIGSGLEKVNRLGVLAQGQKFTLLVNDEVVDTVEDDAFGSGAVALAVGTFAEGDVTVVFDNVDLWVLQTGDLPQNLTVPDGSPEEVDVSAELEEIRANDADYAHEFRRDDGEWALVDEDDVTQSFRSRTLHIRLDRTDWVSWAINNQLDAGSFLAEVDLAHVEGPENAESGLIFRFVDEDNFYFFAVSANGYFSLFKREDAGWVTLVDWTESEALNSGPGTLNRIGVLARDETITLLVNSRGVAQVDDRSLDSGAIGLAAGTFQEAGLEVSFDNFALWDLDE